MPFVLPFLPAIIGAAGTAGAAALAGRGSKGSKTALADSEADRQAQAAERAKTDSSLDYFSGPPDQSPLYKSMLSTRLDATNKAYNNASAGARMRSRIAGFGYESGVGQGAQNETEAQRAGELAAAPGETLQSVVPYTLDAARIRSGEAGDLGRQSTSELSTGASTEQSDLDRRQRLYEAIAKNGMQAISSLGKITKQPQAGVPAGNPYGP